ncbi:peptidoglycan-binding protein [Phenylobacterium aquaticum]|uniref:peptidoglycan-binding protein n=1 Tax=Phenylobacterium aquaticum TaxID=1763816 RepID=UPI003AFA9C4F
MTSGAPWSVKGIDPKAREVAKDLARREGLTLGEWLNRMILEEEGPEDIASESYFTQSKFEDDTRFIEEPEIEAPPPAPPVQAERPVRTYYETPRRPEPEAVAQRPVPPRYEAPEHPADELGRVALALDRLTERIETSEGRTGLAITGVEHSVREAVARIEAAERESIAVAARFEGAVEEARTEQARTAERLRRVEQEAQGPRSAEALRALEQALGKVANHLYEGETRTRETLAALRERVDRAESGVGGAPVDVIEQVVNRVGARLDEVEARTTEAMEGLRAAFSGLDTRMKAVEGGSSPAIDTRLEQLAINLTNRVEATRTEVAQKLQVAADGRFDRMERKLSEMAEHVRRAEQRSAQAIERMGREVLTMADTLNRRVQTTENRSADAIEQVGGEVARIAQAMESRLGKTENVHAEALEKLGAEIGRITDRLTERIASSERRSAQAIDDVGEQVARVTEKMNQRSERASDDLVERIRQSEERTARLLEEAREKIDARLAETGRRMQESIAAGPVAAAVAAPPKREAPLSPFGEDPFPSFIAGEPQGDALARQAFAPPITPPETGQAYAAPFPNEPQRPAFDAQDFEAADGFADLSPNASDDFGDDDFGQETAAEEALGDFMAVGDPPQAREPSRPLTTREVIEQARAAARAASQSDAKARKAKDKPVKAEKAPKPSGASLFSSFGAQRPKRAAGSSLQTALLVVGGAAALSVGAAGFVLMEGKPSGAPPQRVADAINALSGGKGQEIAGTEADTTPFGANPRMSVALAPQAITPVAPVSADTPDLTGRFEAATAAVEQAKPGGVEDLKKVAAAGYAPAQFYLAKLYENGEGGVKKDLVEARRWTERAAEGGDRKAMHNLGIAYFSGAGGAKNSTTAAQWFRRAADLGLVDSQYNLAALYEQGLGVSQNSAEAYKWYLIAARTGDGDARKRADQLKAALSPDARTVAERAAAAFRPAQQNPSVTPTATASVGAPAPVVATAQKALSRLGYYQGPTDGSPSPALKLAVAAYQRDQGVAATGVLDQGTVSRLAVFTR